jgi:hypothetical protein
MFAVAAGLALIAVAAPPKAHGSTWEQQWAKARSMTAALDFDGALPVLKSLVAQPDIPPGPRAQILIELALAYVNVGDQGGASSAFARALTFDANVALPPLAPPKAVQLFEVERQKLAPAPQPPAQPQAPATAPAPSPSPAPAPVSPSAAPPVAVPAPRQTEAAVAPPEPAIVDAEHEVPMRRHLSLPALLTAAGAAVALGGGIAFAFGSQDAAAQLSGSPHPSAVASGLLSERTAFSAASIAAYAVSGALAIACLILLIRGID